MKLQEIFDKCSAHLMSMDGPSLDADGDACVYRGEDGGGCYNDQKCAVGLFIDDQHYDCGLEGTGITGNQAVAESVAKSWDQDDLTEGQLMLLADLQTAHDETSRGWEWQNSIKQSLRRVAKKHCLGLTLKSLIDVS